MPSPVACDPPLHLSNRWAASERCDGGGGGGGSDDDGDDDDDDPHTSQLRSLCRRSLLRRRNIRRRRHINAQDYNTLAHLFPHPSLPALQLRLQHHRTACQCALGEQHDCVARRVGEAPASAKPLKGRVLPPPTAICQWRFAFGAAPSTARQDPEGR